MLGPDKPIVLTLDLHANITRRMVELADAIVGYHTYPHVDMFEVGQKAARLMLRILHGEVRPCMAFRKLPADHSSRELANDSRADAQADARCAGAGAKRQGGGSFYFSCTAVDGHRRDGLRRGFSNQWRSPCSRSGRPTR